MSLLFSTIQSSRVTKNWTCVSIVPPVHGRTVSFSFVWESFCPSRENTWELVKTSISFLETGSYHRQSLKDYSRVGDFATQTRTGTLGPAQPTVVLPPTPQCTPSRSPSDPPSVLAPAVTSFRRGVPRASVVGRTLVHDSSETKTYPYRERVDPVSLPGVFLHQES